MTALTSRGYVYQVAGDPADGPAATQALAASIDADIAACLPPVVVSTVGDSPASLIASWGVTLNAANTLLVAVIRPQVTITPTIIEWWCTVSSGNYDIGIIDWATSARLWSLGSTACPAAGQVTVPIVAGPTLTAGTRYGITFGADNVTLEFLAHDGGTVYPGLALLYDGTIGSGVSATYPIPAVLPAWAESAKVPTIALRA